MTTEDGIRFAGARSTSWDTAFAMLAVLAGPGEARSLVRRAYAFLDAAQEHGRARRVARAKRAIPSAAAGASATADIAGRSVTAPPKH